VYAELFGVPASWTLAITFLVAIRCACAMNSSSESLPRRRRPAARSWDGALERREGVPEAYLFGSQITGRAQPHSDIDVAVCVDGRRASHGGYRYQAELATVLMSGLGVNEVDVVVLNHAPPVLYHRVLRDRQLILTRDLRATSTREGYPF